MRRPILFILFFLCAGIILRISFDFIFVYALGLSLGLVFCVFIFIKTRYIPIFIACLFMIIGMIRAGQSLESYINEPVQADIIGVVQDTGRTRGGNNWAIVKVDNIKIMAYTKDYQVKPIIGHIIYITGELQPLALPINPSDYNQFKHLRPMKVDSVIWADSVSIGERQSSIIFNLRKFRDRLSDVYDKLFPPREAGVIRSMVLGDRSDLDEDLMNIYRAAGIFHILSISGLHIGVLMFALNSCLKLFLNEKHAGLITLIIMIAYTLMTGAATPTVRAVSMGTVLLVGRFLFREYDLLASISFVCIALLLFEPLYLYGVGFQLSFGSVFAIAILTKPIEHFLIKIRFPFRGKIREVLAFSLAVTSVNYIILSYHFFEIPIYSIIGNIVVIPTASILIVFAKLVGLIGLVFMPLAQLLSGIVFFILILYETSSRIFSSLPFAMTSTVGQNLLVSFAGLAVILSFAYVFYDTNIKKRIKWFFISCIILIIAINIKPAGLNIQVLDTYGEYVVLRYKNDTIITGTGRGGEAILTRYLAMTGQHRVHGLLLTKPPRDVDIARLINISHVIDYIYWPVDFGMIPERLQDFDIILLPENSIIWLGGARIWFYNGVNIIYNDNNININEIIGNGAKHIRFK